MFKRKKKVVPKRRAAPQQRSAGRPKTINGTQKKLNTEFFEFMENIPEHGRRRKSILVGTQNARIIADFKASGYTRGFLTADQLNVAPSGMGGLVASVNRHVKLYNHQIYARLISGLMVLEHSGRKATKRSQKVGT